MLSIQVVTFLLFSVILCSVNSYKILVVFPTGSYSHQLPQQAVSQGLADAGHEVTIISPNVFETKSANIRQININFTYECMKIFNFSSPVGPYDLLNLIVTYVTSVSDRVLVHPEVKEIYLNGKSGQYDAVIMEPLAYIPLYAIKEILNTTFIGLSSSEITPGNHNALGNVIHPILHPSFFIGSPKEPTFMDRIRMTYFQIYLEYYERYLLAPVTDAAIKKYFPDLKSTTMTLLRSFDFMIEGVTTELGNVRPLVPNTVQIGFLHLKKPEPLPTSLQNYLDNSKNGVIYLSFGTNVKSKDLKPEIRKTLMSTIRKLNYDVLWKFEGEIFGDRPKNLRTEKWLPQNDLLAHKNIKLFVMQGGLQSMQETISSGVPVVAIPFFGDQYANADKIEELGIGRRVNVPELSVENLVKNIMEVIQNPQ